MPARLNGPSWFQRFLLPGFAFKAVVIGGGYATGRELAEFFVPAGPWGGLLAMAPVADFSFDYHDLAFTRVP